MSNHDLEKIQKEAVVRFRYTLSAFLRRGWGKPLRTPVRIASVPVEIWTQHLWNTSLECHSYSSLLDLLSYCRLSVLQSSVNLNNKFIIWQWNSTMLLSLCTNSHKFETEVSQILLLPIRCRLLFIYLFIYFYCYYYTLSTRNYYYYYYSGPETFSSVVFYKTE
jgi:hypothetical protein